MKALVMVPTLPAKTLSSTLSFLSAFTTGLRSSTLRSRLAEHVSATTSMSARTGSSWSRSRARAMRERA